MIRTLVLTLYAPMLGALLFCAEAPAHAERIPRAVIADATPDRAHPARQEVVHIPTAGLEINGLALVASGAGPHPAFVLFHGLPGNEKNLDLAQSVRRAGWTVVTINYRGSWGSPGAFRFANTLDDARATLAHLRRPDIAAKLSIDPARIAVGGHSMGGWVTAHTLAADPALLGGVMISAGDLGRASHAPPERHAELVAFMNESRETLNGATGETMVDELLGSHAEWSLPALAPVLKDRRVLVLYSADFVQADSESFIAALRGAGATQLQTRFAETDHSWSDKRIALQASVVSWLDNLR
ncbi:MAG: alpha/beta fold hydrolase [Hyphomonadaceae bacterium]|nr:MAG: histidine triad (HIT) protein [Caulobacteraceae bacterium]MBT9445873.1 alpha/beta fold hydrolase [Hyphomonadaceae bacterium]TPW08536.1 MAG: histidine triad (HIT) protein [Alphaproteobacteria bacterium]